MLSLTIKQARKHLINVLTWTTRTAWTMLITLELCLTQHCVVCMHVWKLRNCFCKACRFSTVNLSGDQLFFLFVHALHIHQHDGPIPVGKAQGQSLRCVFWQVCLQEQWSVVSWSQVIKNEIHLRGSHDKSPYRGRCASAIHGAFGVVHLPYSQTIRKKQTNKQTLKSHKNVNQHNWSWEKCCFI